MNPEQKFDHFKEKLVKTLKYVIIKNPLTKFLLTPCSALKGFQINNRCMTPYNMLKICFGIFLYYLNTEQLDDWR